MDNTFTKSTYIPERRWTLLATGHPPLRYRRSHLPKRELERRSRSRKRARIRDRIPSYPFPRSLHPLWCRSVDEGHTSAPALATPVGGHFVVCGRHEANETSFPQRAIVYDVFNRRTANLVHQYRRIVAFLTRSRRLTIASPPVQKHSGRTKGVLHAECGPPHLCVAGCDRLPQVPEKQTTLPSAY